MRVSFDQSNFFARTREGGGDTIGGCFPKPVEAVPRLREKLLALEKTLPGASLVCLVSLDGSLIAHTKENATQHEDTLVAAAALRHAAMNFGDT